MTRTPDEVHVAFLRGPLVFRDRGINNEATPSVGLAYLLGAARGHGYRATLLDPIAEGLNQTWSHPDFPGFACQGLRIPAILDRIPADIDLIAFSLMFSGEWPVQRHLLRDIRARFPGVPIIVGGEHISALTEYTLRDCPAVTLAAVGEGEETLLEILERVRSGQPLEGIPGTCRVGADGAFIAEPPRARVRDIDRLAWPRWEEGYLERFWSAGKSFGVQTERDMPIVSSRGCPFQCTFCSNPRMWTTRYNLRDIDDLVAEIKSYIARYGITSLQFYDLTAITKKKWTIAFCHRLLDEGIRLRWSLPSGTRSEALDDETLPLMQEAGCSYLVYAPESGSARILERIKKKISLDKLTHSILTARRLGIVVRANLIIGFPGETRADVLRTILYGMKLSILGVDEVPINLYSSYPGSELFQELMDAGEVTLDDAYFLSLTSLNSDFTALNPMTKNGRMGPRELALYRLLAMLFNYGIGYLLHLPRIVRTVRNVFGSGTEAATVLEHRLKDAMRRKRADG